MNNSEKEQILKSAESALENAKKDHEVYGIAAAKKEGWNLRYYGRSWKPSDGEEFLVPTETVVSPRTVTIDGKDYTLVEIFMWSSRSGWDFYPVRWCGYAPDVQTEIDKLCKGSVNTRLIRPGDDLDRALELAKVKHFKVVHTVLFGGRWTTNAAGKREYIADKADMPAEERHSVLYYKVIPCVE